MCRSHWAKCSDTCTFESGSSTDQFDWEGRKIKGNRKKTPRKCPFQGRNLKVTTPEEGRGMEKVETCSVAVPSEVGFFGVPWRSPPHNLDQYRGKIQFSTLLADLRWHLNTIPHLRSLLQVSHNPNPRKKRQLNNIGGSQALQSCSSWPKTEIFHLTRHAKERKDRSSTSFSPPFELFLRQRRSFTVPRGFPLLVAMALLWHQTWWLYHGHDSRHASLDPASLEPGPTLVDMVTMGFGPGGQ